MSNLQSASRVLAPSVAQDGGHLERATAVRRLRTINSFPTEILREIFSWFFIFAGQMQRNCLEECMVSRAIQTAITIICCVCWRWRRIIFSMPEAWCRIDMSGAFVGGSVFGLDFMGTRRPLHLRGCLWQYTMSEAAAVSTILDACRSRADRIQTIHLCSSRGDAALYRILQRLASTIMPNLEQLALLEGSTPLGITNDVVDRFIRTRSLRSLHLTNIFIDLRRVPVITLLPQLTSFTLHYTYLADPIIHFIFAHLLVVPVLQELTVSCETCTSQGFNPAALLSFARDALLGSSQYPVTMPFLRKLEFRMLPYELVVVLNQIIRMPALKESTVAFDFVGLERYWSMSPASAPLTQCLECECDLALSIQAPPLTLNAWRREDAAREGHVDWRTKIMLAPLDSGLTKPATCKCTHFVVELAQAANATPTSGAHEPFFQLLMDHPALVHRITHLSVSLTAMQTTHDWRRLLKVAPGLLVLQLTDVDATQSSTAALVLVCAESQRLGACYPAMAPLLRCLHVVYAPGLPTQAPEGKGGAYALTWLVVVVRLLTGISDVLVDGIPTCVREEYKWKSMYQDVLMRTLCEREAGTEFGRCRCGGCTTYGVRLGPTLVGGSVSPHWDLLQ